MSIKTAFCFILLGLATGVPACAQGTFQNLGFEFPVTPLVPLPGAYPYVPITDALPAWQGYLGNNPENLVLYNTLLNEAAARRGGWG
ncbi:MAG TPA: hypothetical protein VI136_01135, partial [Verrucomicrobiae bacterium]